MRALLILMALAATCFAQVRNPLGPGLEEYQRRGMMGSGETGGPSEYPGMWNGKEVGLVYVLESVDEGQERMIAIADSIGFPLSVAVNFSVVGTKDYLTWARVRETENSGLHEVVFNGYESTDWRGLTCSELVDDLDCSVFADSLGIPEAEVLRRPIVYPDNQVTSAIADSVYAAGFPAARCQEVGETNEDPSAECGDDGYTTAELITWEGTVDLYEAGVYLDDELTNGVAYSAAEVQAIRDNVDLMMDDALCETGYPLVILYATAYTDWEWRTILDQIKEWHAETEVMRWSEAIDLYREHHFTEDNITWNDTGDFERTYVFHNSSTASAIPETNDSGFDVIEYTANHQQALLMSSDTTLVQTTHSLYLRMRTFDMDEHNPFSNTTQYGGVEFLYMDVADNLAGKTVVSANLHLYNESTIDLSGANEGIAVIACTHPHLNAWIGETGTCWAYSLGTTEWRTDLRQFDDFDEMGNWALFPASYTADTWVDLELDTEMIQEWIDQDNESGFMLVPIDLYRNSIHYFASPTATDTSLRLWLEIVAY